MKSDMHSMRDEARGGFSDIRHAITIQNQPKPEKSPAPFVMIVLAAVTIMGGILAWGFSNINMNMQRESDYRFSEFNKAQAAMYTDMRRDDIDEKQNSYKDGVRDADAKNLLARLDRYEASEDSRNDRVADILIRLIERMERVEGIAVGAQYEGRHHREKQGSQGHPVAERKISGNAAVNRVLPNP